MAVPLTVAIALAGTGDMIFQEDVRRSYEGNGDLAAILQGAASATPASVLGWWTGVWIEPSSPYYRPLASSLFYAEYVAFGGRWRGFCVVTWLLHAGVCVLVLFLLRRLWTGSPGWRVVPGVLAAALFSIPCETTVDGPHWGNRGIARGIMPYWPAQTDAGCLLFALAALVCVDRWLLGRRRGDLIGAAVCFVCALLFKEQALVIPLLAGALALYRRLPPKTVGLITLVGVVASGLFLLLRGALVPEAWGPTFHGVGPAALKLAVYFSEPSAAAVVAGQGWVLVSAPLLALCVAVGIFRPRLAVYALLAGLAAILLPPQLLAGNMALPTVTPHYWWLLRVTLLLLGLVAAWALRCRAPTVPLLGGLLIVHLPILHVFGPHYYYWPVAWWSMLNATLVVAVVMHLAPGGAGALDGAAAEATPQEVPSP